MSTYDLYGILSSDINATKGVLEAALGVSFDARESSYQGGAYFVWGQGDGENFVLKRNQDPYDEEPAESAFSKHPILFYVNDTQRSEYWKSKLINEIQLIGLLRHEDL